MSNFYATLAVEFERHRERDCLRCPDGRIWTYGDLSEWVDLMGGALSAAGVSPGERVVVQVEKSPQNLALYLAALRMGAVFVPLNTAYTRAELDYFIADAQPRVFVGAETRDDVLSLTLNGAGEGSLIEACTPLTTPAPVVERTADDLAAILYTSGTTGRSKGAMLSHGNLASNAQALSAAWGWRDDDVLLHALPIFHVHGLFIASHCALLNGTPMEFLPRFDAALVADALQRCTVMMGVPTFYVRLLKHPGFPERNLEHVRVFICGSAPLTEGVFAAWEAATGHRILERYGMSETIINTSNPLHGERVPGTVGFPLPGLELRIADDSGVPRPTGEVGTIEVRGPNVFGGYWRMPDKTAEEIREDGFFITGDLGTVDVEGRVSIVGRAKDLVISGGYNVYPKEVERLLDEMPQITESAVIGVPHADFGEAVVAVVVPAKDEVTLGQVEASLKDQVARFKQPKQVINVPELPRNTMGKVQKNLLRDAYIDLFKA